jgi:hypothetical protein
MVPSTTEFSADPSGEGQKTTGVPLEGSAALGPGTTGNGGSVAFCGLRASGQGPSAKLDVRQRCAFHAVHVVREVHQAVDARQDDAHRRKTWPDDVISFFDSCFLGVFSPGACSHEQRIDRGCAHADTHVPAAAGSRKCAAMVCVTRVGQSSLLLLLRFYFRLVMVS